MSWFKLSSTYVVDVPAERYVFTPFILILNLCNKDTEPYQPRPLHRQRIDYSKHLSVLFHCCQILCSKPSRVPSYDTFAINMRSGLIDYSSYIRRYRHTDDITIIADVLTDRQHKVMTSSNIDLFAVTARLWWMTKISTCSANSITLKWVTLGLGIEANR